MHNSEWKKLLGFILFIFGMLSLMLLLVGANFSFMKWIDFWGKGIGLLLRILMVGGGIIVSYMGWLEESKR